MAGLHVVLRFAFYSRSRTTPPALVGRMMMRVVVEREHDVSAYFGVAPAVKRRRVEWRAAAVIL